MEFILKYLWIPFIVMHVVNSFGLKSRSKHYIDQDSGLKTGYQQLFLGYLLLGGIPWLIMAIGGISGQIQSVFEFLNIRAMKPIVLAFYGSLILLYILGIIWIYFRNGAEFLERHPGLVRSKTGNGVQEISAEQLKKLFPFIIIAGVIGMLVLWMIGGTET